MAGPVGVEELAARLVDTLVGVSPEIVALGLEQVGGEPVAAITVVIGKRGAHGRQGDADERPPPRKHAASLPWPDRLLAEVRVEKQIGEVGIAVECLLDLPRKALRMMQPPRHMRATPPLLSFPVRLVRHGRASELKPWA